MYQSLKGNGLSWWELCVNRSMVSFTKIHRKCNLEFLSITPIAQFMELYSIGDLAITV